MAESTHEAQTQTVKQPQITSNVTTLCCESCVVVKDQLIQVCEELKSTRTIIALLQEDIVKLNANYKSKPSQRGHSPAHDQVSQNWRPVLQNDNKKWKKPVVSNRQSIPLSNRFTPLSDVLGSTVPITPDKEETSNGSTTYNKKPIDRLLN